MCPSSTLLMSSSLSSSSKASTRSPRFSSRYVSLPLDDLQPARTCNSGSWAEAAQRSEWCGPIAECSNHYSRKHADRRDHLCGVWHHCRPDGGEVHTFWPKPYSQLHNNVSTPATKQALPYTQPSNIRSAYGTIGCKTIVCLTKWNFT